MSEKVIIFCDERDMLGSLEFSLNILDADYAVIDCLYEGLNWANISREFEQYRKYFLLFDYSNLKRLKEDLVVASWYLSQKEINCRMLVNVDRTFSREALNMEIPRAVLEGIGLIGEKTIYEDLAAVLN